MTIKLKLFFLFLMVSVTASAQSDFSLEDCLEYALAEQPALKAIRLEDSLAQLNNKIALSAWKPAFFVNGRLRNNLKQQVSIFPDLMDPSSGETTEVEIGTAWVSDLGANASQLIYNPEVMRDARLQDARVQRARLLLEEREIAVKARVSTAFYAALRATETLRILEADVERLERALRDARLLYEEGINDKVDYKRATIALNRSRADREVARLDIFSRLAELKETMGYPGQQPLNLNYDINTLIGVVTSDSLTRLDPVRRVELLSLDVERQIQATRIQYFREAWLPSVSANAAYNFNWQANNFGELYNRNFPNAFVALSLNVPLFQGGRRFHQVELSRVAAAQIDYDAQNLQLLVEREFLTATNDYRANRLAFLAAALNAEIAQEVYEVVLLQYREGIEPFLEVVIAETDLQTTRLTALTQLLAAMVALVEVRRSAGTL